MSPTVLLSYIFQVGVHIADVSYFVKPETPLDLEAAHRFLQAQTLLILLRSTSTYLVERRLDMLPSLLTTEVTSLCILFNLPALFVEIFRRSPRLFSFVGDGCFSQYY